MQKSSHFIYTSIQRGTRRHSTSQSWNPKFKHPVFIVIKFAKNVTEGIETREVVDEIFTGHIWQSN